MKLELLEAYGEYPKGVYPHDVPDATAKSWIDAGRAKAVVAPTLPALPTPAPNAVNTDGGSTSDFLENIKAALGEVYIAGALAAEKSAGSNGSKGAVNPTIANLLGNIGKHAAPKPPRSFGEWIANVGNMTKTTMHEAPGVFQKSWNLLADPDGYNTRVNQEFETEFSSARVYQKGATSMSDLTTTKASVMSEVSGALGGFAVPIEFFPEIIKFAEEQSMLLKAVKKYPMAGLQMQIPALDYSGGGGGLSPYLSGVIAGWFAEGGTLPTTNAVIRQITLKANLLGMSTQATRTLLADNAVGFQPILIELLGDAIAFYSTLAILAGTGADQPLGIQNCAATILQTRTGDSSNGALFTDLAGMRSKLLPGAMKRSFWMISPSEYANILGMTDGTGKNMYLPNFPGNMGGQVSYPGEERLLGIPFEVSQYAAAHGTKGDINLIDPMGYAYAQRQDIEIAVSEHVGFLNNLLTWRALYRADGKARVNTYLTLANGDQVSPFICRNT